MIARLRRAALFVSLLPTAIYAELESQRLTRLARRGVPVADRAADLERKVSAAVARIDSEVS